MTTRTDETFQEAVLALRDWLVFLDDKRKETNDQLERAKRRAEKEGTSVMEEGTAGEDPSRQVLVQNEEDRETWL